MHGGLKDRRGTWGHSAAARAVCCHAARPLGPGHSVGALHLLGLCTCMHLHASVSAPLHRALYLPARQ